MQHASRRREELARAARLFTGRAVTRHQLTSEEALTGVSPEEAEGEGAAGAGGEEEETPLFDFVLCVGNFSSRDEDIFLKLHDAEQPPPPSERQEGGGGVGDDDEAASAALAADGALESFADGSFALSAAERVERARLLFKSHLR